MKKFCAHPALAVGLGFNGIGHTLFFLSLAALVFWLGAWRGELYYRGGHRMMSVRMSRILGAIMAAFFMILAFLK
jgi:hypothetical protein